jgi:hypothetical protein
MLLLSSSPSSSSIYYGANDCDFCG